MYQCVDAVPGARYYLNYRFKTSLGADVSGFANCTVAFIPANTVCQYGNHTGGFNAEAAHTDDRWVTGSGEGIAPDNARFIYVSCGSPTTLGYYDQLYLGRVNPPTKF